MCHAVGSPLNKCANNECVSLNNKSKCDGKSADACSSVKYGDMSIVSDTTKKGNLQGSN